jgi:ribosomal protein L21
VVIQASTDLSTWADIETNSVGFIPVILFHDAEAGAKVTFDQVLAVGEGDQVKIGTPTVAGAKVSGTVLEQGRGEKLIVFRYRRRQNSSRRRGGHRLWSCRQPLEDRRPASETCRSP